MTALMLVLLTSCCIAGANEIKVVRRLGSIPEEDGSYEEAHSHLVAKRQTQCLFFFLREPPTSLQCNPDASKSLILYCQLSVNSRNPPEQLSIGWFFSVNGEDAKLIQVSRFIGQIPYPAFENVLVVLNALPGAYFCSISLVGVTQILDSMVLRISNTTLQDICDVGQSPTEQPQLPRCAQQGVPTPNYIPRPTNTFKRTNTVNFLRGVNGATLTYSAGFKNTMNIPLETMTTNPTPSPTPPATTTTTQQVGETAQAGTIAGATIVVVVVGVIVLMLPALMCYLRSIKKRRQKMDNPNVVPLMYHRPPNRPLPALNGKPKRVENIEMAEVNRITPLYETATNRWEPCYPDGTAMENWKNKKQVAPSPPAIEPLTYQNPHGRESATYYSHPKFKKEQTMERGMSTSTHTYGDLVFENSMAEDAHYTYIPVNHIKPFRQNSATTLASREADRDEALYQGNLRSSLAYAISELPGHMGGEEVYDYTSDVEEEEEEEEGEDKSNGRDAYYINSKGLQRIVEGAVYINSKRNQDERVVPDATRYKTKTVPGGRRAKSKTRRVQRNKSLPMILGECPQDYTCIARDTLNYTSVYSNTINNQKSILADKK